MEQYQLCDHLLHFPQRKNVILTLHFVRLWIPITYWIFQRSRYAVLESHSAPTDVLGYHDLSIHECVLDVAHYHAVSKGCKENDDRRYS